MGEKKQYREFTVTPGICGFRIRIGCTEAYFGDAESLHKAIIKYLDDPTGAEEAYRKYDLRHANLADHPGELLAAAGGILGKQQPEALAKESLAKTLQGGDNCPRQFRGTL